MYYPIYISLLFWLVPHLLTDVRCFVPFEEEQTYENKMELSANALNILGDLYLRRHQLICCTGNTFESIFA